MWLYLLGGVLLLIGIVGGIATGGIFTLVFIPIGAIILFSAAGYGMWSRAAQGSGGADLDAHPSTGDPLPHTAEGDPARVSTSPESLADARRANQ